MRSSSPHALASGSSLHRNRFEVKSFVGHGSFGICYQAVDRTLGRDVAIKEFYPQGCARQGARVVPGPPLQDHEYQQGRDEFVREADVLARFNHPGIVSILDVFSDNDTAYMVMEWLDGTTLHDLVERSGAPLSEATAIDHVKRLGLALSLLHHDSIIHRDIKPDNVMRTDDGRIVLIDFGIARAFGTRTVALEAMGSPGFAPPEQYRGRARYGPWTDVYALGATLFFLLSAEVPASAPDREQGVPLDDLVCLRADAHCIPLQGHVVDAIQWALELDAAHRPQTVDEFVSALEGRLATRRPTVPLPSRCTTATRPFKFSIGQAATLAELAALCDRSADEAVGYLVGGILGGWLAANGEAALAKRAGELASRCRNATDVEKRQNLELLVRDILREAGHPFEPRIDPGVPVLGAGTVPLGASAECSVTLRASHGRHAWGEIELSPPIPGVLVSRTFDTLYQPKLKVEVKGGACLPGKHQACLLIRPAGTEATTRLPFEVTVQALDLTLEPRAINFGGVAFDSVHQQEICIHAEPREGVLRGRAQFQPACSGLDVPAEFGGNPCKIPVVLDTGGLQAGTRYQGTLVLETLQGRLDIPIGFAVAVNFWRLLFLLVSGASVGTACGGVLRGVVALFLVIFSGHSTGLVLGYETSYAPTGVMLICLVACLSPAWQSLRSRGLPATAVRSKNRGVAEAGCIMVLGAIAAVLWVVWQLLVLLWASLVILYKGLDGIGFVPVILGDCATVGLMGFSPSSPVLGWCLLGALVGGAAGLSRGLAEIDRRSEMLITLALSSAFLLGLLLRGAFLLHHAP